MLQLRSATSRRPRQMLPLSVAAHEMCRLGYWRNMVLVNITVLFAITVVPGCSALLDTDSLRRQGQDAAASDSSTPSHDGSIFDLSPSFLDGSSSSTDTTVRNDGTSRDAIARDTAAVDDAAQDTSSEIDDAMPPEDMTAATDVSDEPDMGPSLDGPDLDSDVDDAGESSDATTDSM